MIADPMSGNLLDKTNLPRLLKKKKKNSPTHVVEFIKCLPRRGNISAMFTCWRIVFDEPIALLGQILKIVWSQLSHGRDFSAIESSRQRARVLRIRADSLRKVVFFRCNC